MPPMHPNCRCCLTPQRPIAEFLVELAKDVLYPQSALVLVRPDQLALYKLAIDLWRKPGLVVRALMEEWDQQRIVKELY